MKSLLLLFSVFVLIVSCKKEGLSKSTGNVEITLPNGNWNYFIYTEDQFIRLQNFQSCIPLRQGYSGNRPISEKGLLAGHYGIHFYENGTGFQRMFSVVGDKLTRYTLP